MPVKYTATPTIAAFSKSNAFGRVIAGPVGSGKTTGCMMEVFRRSMAQSKAPDGFRYTRWAFVRITLKQLKDTVLKEIHAWLGDLGEWKVSDNTFYLNFSDVRSEWIFIPLENAEDQARLLSMQLTGAWLNELIEMNYDILAPVSGRIGRYPSAQRGAPSWFGIIADTNMPIELSDWHRLMTEPPANWQIFIQPGGLTPQAENLAHLLQTDETKQLPVDHPRRLAQGRTYYENLLANYGADSDWVKRYVDAKFGDDPSGQAVFKQSFKPSIHVVPETLVIPGYPLIVGQDFGRNPWSLIGQVDHTGRLLVHQEVAATNVGLEKHILEALKPALWSNKFSGCKVIVVGDPSGIAAGTIGEETSFDCIRRLGLAAFPAPTNDIDPRLRACEALFGRLNGIAINGKGCPWLVRALSGGYRFKKHKDGGWRSVPEKFDREGFSHIADCLQYIALVVHGNLVNVLASRLTPRKKWAPHTVSAAGWT